ncbi:MAG: sulfurtransferase [Deltaproteobacteria bacterium]|nr:sulfurtransferase [Deltaproteobacteria bacterium]
MRKIKFVLAFMAVLLLLPFATFAGAAEVIVSTDWLQQNLSNANVVILDVRKVEEYKDGHIPNAINIFYNSWAVTRDGLTNELPAEDDLRDLIGSLGVGKDTTVVVVSKNDPVPERFNMTRVAWTLRYAGVQKVSVLNGGYDRWAAEKKEISTTPNRGKKVAYDAPFNKTFYADKVHVMASLGKVTIVDVREAPFFKGEKKLDFVAKTGRIKGAINLPNSLIFTPEGTFKSPEALAAAATPVVGTDKEKEIIVYCDTGKTCTAWWLVFHDVLGYKNVMDYDGSSMEWLKDPAAPVEP